VSHFGVAFRAKGVPKNILLAKDFWEEERQRRKVAAAIASYAKQSRRYGNFFPVSFRPERNEVKCSGGIPPVSLDYVKWDSSTIC